MNSVVILPSLNPDEKLISTAAGLISEGFDKIVVVNDGSAPEYLKPFEKLSELPEVTLLTHEVNKGKGRAMKTAFDYIHENLPGVNGVVTADGDGQHLSRDVRSCVEAMEKTGRFVLGCRDFSLPQVPKKSRYGNNITKAIFKVCCGMEVSDTQTGLRAIPFGQLPMMLKIEGERYEYETNQLLELKLRKLPVEEVVIETVYIDDNASSHFHPVRDSWRIYKLIFKFMGRNFKRNLKHLLSRKAK